ncbi:hypothetical protein M431DRAFT_458567 [Trichoderma harzianum CBS 226.95]|uniref:Uncharacterized protein n=1 Tax=Trichoderma harzianum CBS 226.95 TaxID=983964 RepID=A0A2T4A7W0_TRIHA|nr:hypothetical protein M431DRAFT_458567 [Trichoderma harzianum CBS 226.95]PTB53160.1 hypothetical protein M431DRAFT_458567 [Trichoderma harzianum CBS 226.95]
MRVLLCISQRHQVSSRITLKSIGALQHGCAGRATRAMSPDHDGSLPRNRYLDMYEYANHFFRLLLLGIGGVRCLYSTWYWGPRRKALIKSRCLRS